MIHYMKRAYFTRVFDNIGFKCKIICHLKISAFAGMTPLIPVNVAVYMSPFIRLLKNAPACAEASAGRQMQVELREIPFAGAPNNFKLEIPQPTFHNPKLP
jgi:hypothetical protein